MLAGSFALSELEAGIHTLHLRFLDASGQWSSTLKQTFYLPVDGGGLLAPGDGLNTIETAEIKVDDGNFVPVSAADGAFDDAIEAVSLSLGAVTGYHAVRVRFRDSRGAWSTDTRAAGGLADDSDWDGLPDAWERKWFGNLDQTGFDDPDEDGYTNAEEYERGQNPLVADVGGELVLSGFVRDPAGTPLSGVAICAAATTYGCDTRTNALGYFAFGAGRNRSRHLQPGAAGPARQDHSPSGLPVVKAAGCDPHQWADFVGVGQGQHRLRRD